MSQRRLAASAVVGFAVLATVALWWGGASPASAPAGDAAPPTDELPESRPQEAPFAGRIKGSPTAPITVYEVADFQCPACRVFWEETMPALEREYVVPGKVRLIFVNLPLQEIHPNAAAAHQFAMCAADQGRFWPIHDRLFDQQRAWAPLADPTPVFSAMADSVGLVRPALETCLGDESVKQRVLQEREGVLRAGVKSTPSFIIRAGDEQGLFPGAVPIDAWRPILDSLFDKAVGR